MNLKLWISTLICAVGLASAVYAQRGQGGPHGPSPEEKEKIRLAVGMSKDQQNQIEAIYAEGHRLEGESRKKSGELMKQLRKLTDSYSYDRKQAEAIRRELCDNYRQRLQIHADIQDKVRKVLNREQFDKLTELANARFEQMRKDWQQRRGPGGPGGPGGGNPSIGRGPGG